MAARKKNGTQSAVRLGTDGFEIEYSAGHSIHVRWKEVRGIAAWKQDCFTVDEICLGFRIHGTDHYAVVSESTDGCDDLISEMQRRFPGHNESWWSRVAFPPFLECWTVIWGDAPEPVACPTCGMDISGLAESACPKCDRALLTERCIGCRGVGKTYERFWWVLAGLAAFLALIWWGGAQMGWLTEPLVLRAGAGVSALAVACALMLFFAWLDRGELCARCEGTGWWNPRGRAFRVVPEVRNTSSQR